MVKEEIVIVDYRPSLKKHFLHLAGNWLLDILDGKLEEEDEFTLNHPDKAYLSEGGFVFFALQNKNVVGCVALKRLDENTFELAKLYVDGQSRNAGIATKLVERCISRCKENDAMQLWLQTTMSMTDAHRLYYKLGFKDMLDPKQMTVLGRTEKIMMLEITGKTGIFFYGSYMNTKVLKAKNIYPEIIEVAMLTGYDIMVGPLANVFTAANGVVFGIIIYLTEEECKILYGPGKSLGGLLYVPEPVIVELPDGTNKPALCYVCKDMTPKMADDHYIEKIVQAATRNNFPAWYINKLKSFGTTKLIQYNR